MRDLKIIILAAGKGSRMKAERPKILHSLGHRPMVGYVLECASQLNPQEIFLVTHPSMDEDLRQSLGTDFSFQLVHQMEPLGTAHAVLAARPFLEGFQGQLLVLFADTPHLTPETLEPLLDKLEESETIAVTIMGMLPSNKEGYARIQADKEGRVERIIEQKDASPKDLDMAFCNAGVMALKGKYALEILDKIDANNAAHEFYLTDAIRSAQVLGLEAYAVEGPEENLVGINTKKQLSEAEKRFQEKWREKFLDQGVTLVDPSTVYFSYDTQIGRECLIEPHVVLGPGVCLKDYVTVRSFSHLAGSTLRDYCTVGPFARLRPGTDLHQDVRVGNFVEVKNAVLQEGAKVNHLSYVGDSEVGAHSNIGAGTITCNYDGVSKHKTVIGRSTFVGSNTCLVAPVTLGDHVVVGAGSVVTKDVPDQALILARSEPIVKPQGGTRFLEKRKSKKQGQS